MKIGNYMAFLNMIAFAEGTIKYGNQRGYDVLVGGGLFTDMSKHPNARIYLPRYKIYSSAAGRYQFLFRTWEVFRKRHKLPDFGPASQDQACIEQLRECGSLEALDRGDFRTAVVRACKIWASLPGAGYGQREVKIAALEKIYRDSGGVIA